MAAVPEQGPYLGEFAGDDGGVEAEPTGHDGQRQRLHLGQPQQRRVRLLEVPQTAQGDRALQRHAVIARRLLRVEPQPQVRVEPVPPPGELPGGRRSPNGGQQQRYHRQHPAGRTTHRTGPGGAGLLDAKCEGLAGQFGGRGGAGRAQVGVGQHGVPALGEERCLSGVLRSRQVGHGSPASTNDGQLALTVSELEGGCLVTGPEPFTHPTQLTSHVFNYGDCQSPLCSCTCPSPSRLTRRRSWPHRYLTKARAPLRAGRGDCP